MKALLVTWWAGVRESYWFLPSLMAVGAIALSLLTTTLDRIVGSAWLDDVSWLYANKPDGARAVLSTVAGSMITVAGVTFSMTILSISHTTSQIGPRLLSNFMRDTSNQLTLGVFISTFLYCLMVLRTVRNADDAPPGEAGNIDLVAAFVPNIAVSVGLGLAICSVGVLIFFIHHIPESIHISNIVAGVGRDLNHGIENQFPSLVGSPHADTEQRQTTARLPDQFYQTARRLNGTSSGYVEFVDTAGLMSIACEYELVIRLRCRAGDFVTPGSVLLLVSPRERVDDHIESRLIGTFVTGAQRTATQNLRFVMNQLVEVAMRALSPGVNDPFTAMNCMDWLQSGLENLASRNLPDAHRYDDQHHLRIVTEPETFSSFASLVFDQLRPYVAVDRNASVHLMEMLGQIVSTTQPGDRRRALLRHARLLRRECRDRLPDQSGLELLTDRYRSIIRLVRDPNYQARILATSDWLGGRS